MGNKAAVVSRIWGLRPTTVRDAVAKGIRIGQFNLERILKAFLPSELPQKFEDLLVPMKVITTDYYGQAEVIAEHDACRPLTNGSIR